MKRVIADRVDTWFAGLPRDHSEALAALRALFLKKEDECETLRAQKQGLEKERSRLVSALADERHRCNELASLYVATHRLHVTLDRSLVLEALKEIVAGLVGCEELAVFELIGKPPVLVPVATSGIEPANLSMIATGSGLIGRTAVTAQTWVTGRGEPTLDPDGRLTACVPLNLDGRVVGVIALYGLLSHKPHLTDSDLEILDVLSTHAATAITATRLQAKSGQA